MPAYIDVIRHFVKLGAELDAHPEWIPRPGGPLTWKRVLRPDQTDHVVLLAPSGYGKTTEVIQEARRRRSQGAHAIAAIAVAVIEDGLRGGLDTENRDALDAWLKTSDPAILFVDGVDELALRHKNLGDLIRKLDSGIPFSQRTVQVVVAARTGMWLPQHTGELQHFLAGARDAEPAVLQLTFAPLDEAALRALAIGYGAKDIDAFIACLRREEIGALFDIRPRDVRWLVRKWNESGRLGKWVELLTDFCDRALEDETPERALRRELSVREGHLGLQRTAAGMLLGRRHFISVPSAERSEQTISSRRLFDDWTIAGVQNLLETALFVHKGMNGQAVQLAADTLMPFLAARWLAQRARAGLDIDALQELVMVRAFGEREFHIPESRLKLSGWLATELPEFRKLILHDRPDVLLFGGDPDLLTDRELEDGLVAISVGLLAGADDRFTRSGVLRKLARPSAEPIVLSLLSTCPTTRSLQILALQLAKFGRYRTCVPLALSLALDRDADTYVRSEAINAVIEAGAAADRDRLIPLTTDPSSRIRAELLELVPAIVRGKDLVRLMLGGGDLEFRFYVRRMTERISDTDLDAIVTGLEPILRRTIIDAQTEPAYCAALPIVTEVIHRGRSTPASISILRAIDRLTEHHTVFISDEELEQLRRGLAANAGCRRALLEAQLADGLAAHYRMRMGRFGQATLEDVPWLAGLWEKSVRKERRRAARNSSPQVVKLQRSDLIDRLIDDLYGDLTEAEQTPARAQLPQELLVRIDARIQRNKEFERERVRNDAKLKRQAVSTRAKNAKAFQPRIKEIENGDDSSALVWAWQHLGEEQKSQRARRDFSRLVELVGEELVPSFSRGLRAYWRKNAVAIPDPSNNEVMLRDLTGLTGLTLEIDDGLDLRALSPNEARLAATYALYELNAFPLWFEDLVAAQPTIVKAVLHEVISRVWAMRTEKPTLLRFGPYAAKSIATLMRHILLDVAKAKPPGSRHVLEDGIDTLLTSGDDPLRVVNIAKTGIVADSGDQGRLAQWLRLLAHVDPVAAADHLESMRTTDVASYERVLEIVANFLEQDVSDRYHMSLVTAMHSPRALGTWLRLLLLGVSPERDIEHPSGTTYAVGARDHAQGFRNRCLNLLRQNPTEAAHDVLAELATDPTLAGYHSAIVPSIEYQLEVARDAIARPLSEDEVLAIERGDERPPRTLDDLLALVRSHITHVDRLISKDDDFSYRDVFSEKTAEREIQLWAASNLRERARGLYTVVRENVVADDKEVDVSAIAAGVGQVPIEIKPLGPYSLPALEQVIVDQLLGQYMQPPERRCGVLLLVRRERERWKVRGRWRGLGELVSALQEFASVVGHRNGKTIVVEVVDLLAKSGSSTLRG
jgi:hypothetical protein